MEPDTPVSCDRCGGPCDATDAITDGNTVLCGSLYGNGCDQTAIWSGDIIVDAR